MSEYTYCKCGFIKGSTTDKRPRELCALCSERRSHARTRRALGMAVRWLRAHPTPYGCDKALAAIAKARRGKRGAR